MTGPSTRRHFRRAFGLALLSVLLMQAAWALVVPPFRGIDEHEHAFKAAAVASGDWHASHPGAPSGWGETVTVPTDLAKAAEPVCAVLKYVKDNCVPRPSVQPGMSEVGSSAARYNPVFYALIGTVARPFHGTVALYAMRTTAALMCALLLAFAFVTLRRWSASDWLPPVFLLAATPTTLYSTAIAAPNGIELASAFLVWSALLGISRLEPGDRRVDGLVLAATVGAVPLCLVRTLGPLWLILIVATCALLASRAQVEALLRRHSLQFGVAVTLVLGAFGPIWSYVAATNSVTHGGTVAEGMWHRLPLQWILWFAQSVAAFPARNESAPATLYAVSFGALWILVAVAWRHGRGRERIAMLMILVVTTGIAVGVTSAAYATSGFVWQGRYGYPYAVGFLLICGVVLDRRPLSRRNATWVLGTTALVTVITELVGMLHVLHTELADSPLAGTAAWPAPPSIVVIALVLASTGIYVAAAMSNRPSQTLTDSAQPELAETQRASVA